MGIYNEKMRVLLFQKFKDSNELYDAIKSRLVGVEENLELSKILHVDYNIDMYQFDVANDILDIVIFIKHDMVIGVSNYKQNYEEE